VLGFCCGVLRCFALRLRCGREAEGANGQERMSLPKKSGNGSHELDEIITNSTLHFYCSRTVADTQTFLDHD
jgi:hypothetical protein